MFKILATAILAASALAVPVDPQPYCDGWYVVEKWGHIVRQPYFNSSRGAGTFKGCEERIWKHSDDVFKRQTISDDARSCADCDTTVEAQDGAWEDGWLYGNISPHDDLWNQALNVCGSTYCDGQQEIRVASGRSDAFGDLVLQLDGSFADATLRDNFITLIKDAFYKALEEREIPPDVGSQQRVGKGLNYLHAVTGYGAASGYSLTMRMQNKPSSDNDCPTVVKQIASFGALVPDLGPVFGLAGAICGA